MMAARFHEKQLWSDEGASSRGLEAWDVGKWRESMVGGIVNRSSEGWMVIEDLSSHLPPTAVERSRCAKNDGINSVCQRRRPLAGHVSRGAVAWS